MLLNDSLYFFLEIYVKKKRSMIYVKLEFLLIILNKFRQGTHSQINFWIFHTDHQLTQLHMGSNFRYHYGFV